MKWKIGLTFLSGLVLGVEAKRGPDLVPVEIVGEAARARIVEPGAAELVEILGVGAAAEA